MRFALLALLPMCAPAQTPEEFFESRVRPVLARNCYACHGPDKQFSGLRVDSRAGLLKGGSRGAAIAPGQAVASLLVKAIRRDGIQMPPGAPLKDAEISAIEQWIAGGAAWPGKAKPIDRHWAFEPVKARPSSNVDRFIAAGLSKAGLRPAPPADRTTLIRRLSFVLTGLPPKPSDVDRFVADKPPEAYRNLVERTLASPHFGEQWARHWMDVMRFGETRGYEWNYEIGGAWRYRDYLIRAFNEDVPYDQLIREHIAGDLLEKPRTNRAERINESKIGTAFFRLGEAGHDDCIKFRDISLDVVDNQIDTLTKAFQGLTGACARCHNHKLDPIPTEDYYGTFGVLNSSRPVNHTLDLPEVHAADQAKLSGIKLEIRAELLRLARESIRNLRMPEAKPTLESPLFPWTELSKSDDIPAAWRALAERYRREARERTEFNQKNFTPFAPLSQWQYDGIALRGGQTASGDFAIAPDGDAVISGVFPAGVFTNVLSDKFNASLRSPYLPKDRKYISVRLSGGKLGARRTVIDNCAIGETYKVLDAKQLQWLKLETYAEEKRLPVYFEMVTKTDNPRIPDRPGVLKDYKDEEIENSPRSYFGITGAVLHDFDGAPKEELGHMLPLFDTEVRSREDLAAAYRVVLSRALDAWAADRAAANETAWLDWAFAGGVFPNAPNSSDRLQELVSRYRAAEKAIAPPRVVEGMADPEQGFDSAVLVAGNPSNYGPTVPRHFLSLLGNRRFETTGSGRRELAELIAGPSNPLTARVMVNRIWHHLFGRGIVRTTDNFGSVGDAPSHPELLDALAAQFIADRWSIKTLIRHIVLSETFQRSNAGSPESDPQNLLLSHYPLRRLTAESVRDAILMTAGRLDPTLFGPSIHPARREAKDYRRLFTGPLDGNGRRSIYTKITRMEGPKFLEIFDYPPPLAARGERDITNVPAQALAMLNDPFVLSQAGVWAESLLRRPHAGPEQRIQEMFRSALGRPAAAPELERFRGLALELAGLHRADLMNSQAVWKDVAHAIFNLKEFLYVR